MKHCKVLIKTKSEFKKVVDICYNQGITWAISSRAFMPSLLQDGTPIILRIESGISWGEKSEYAEDTGLTKCSYSEFIAKHKTIDETNFAVVVKTKKQLHDVETVLFDRGIIWGCSGKTHRDDFPYSPTVFHIHRKYISYSSIDSHDDNDYDMTYTFKDFMDMYKPTGDTIEKEFAVVVKTKKQLHDVETVLFDRGIIWLCSGKTHRDDFPYSPTTVYIKDNRLTCDDESKYNSYEYYTYSFKGFMDKYESKTSDIMKHCSVKVKTKAEVLEVGSICSQHGVIWAGGDKHWIPDGLENGVYLVIEEVITNTLSLTTAKDLGPLYSFKEFMDKFAKSSSQILYRFKTEAEFIEEFGAEFHDETNWNSSGNMDHLFGKELSDKENNNIQDIDQCRTDCDNWTIYKSMITEIKAGTIPIEITMNFKTEKFKLSNDLFKVDKPTFDSKDNW